MNMKTKLLPLLLLFFLSLGWTSCEDDEHFFLYQLSELYNPDEPISGTYVPITGSSSVGITGGVAPYSISIADETIAKATLGEKDGLIGISPVKLGTTYLRVRDANGLTAQIEVKVGEGRQNFGTIEIRVEIEGDMDEVQMKELEAKVIDDSDMKPTGVIKFVYTTKDKGTLTLISSTEVASSTEIKSSFVRTLEQLGDKSRYCITTTLDGKSHSYYIDYPEKTDADEVVTRDQGPLTCFLVEDVTEIYKKDHSKVTSVKRFYDGWLSR